MGVFAAFKKPREVSPGPAGGIDGTVDESKTAHATDDAIPNDSEGEQSTEEDHRPTENAQAGVQEVEGVTLTWSKRSLIAIFCNIWLLYFVNAFQSSILSNLLPYATSDFESHSLLNVISVVAASMSAATYIPLSKILDVFGRAEGFLFMAVLATLGLVLMACSYGIATFCAAQVFYSIGFGGMTYCVDVITADATHVRNRGLAFAFTSSPYMITAFAGSKAAEGFYEDINWRWGFGTFSIVFPVVAAPLYFILKYNVRKAKKAGVLGREPSGRTAIQSIWHYIVEFDALGVFLFSAGLVIFLLPFNIADAAPEGWRSGYIIAMLVVGFVLLVLFGLYETLLAPTPMLNFTSLANRTVVGACLLDATYQISYYCWANYFTSFLQVVNNLSISNAGYVNSTFDVVSGVLLLLVGYLVRRTGRFKWLLFIAVPLYMFAQGLMIYFRRPGQSVGYLVMCEVFISIGGSVFIICQQISILAAVDHQHIAAALALLNVVGTVGNALGATISGAIWTNIFRDALARYLPESALPDLDAIYEDLDTQLSYDMGTPERLGIQEAYGYTQTRMLSAGLGVMGLAFFWVLLIKNINLAKIKQVKGTVW